MTASGSDSHDSEFSDNEDDTSDATTEALREAFLAGFRTARTGTYYGDIPEISRELPNPSSNSTTATISSDRS